MDVKSLASELAKKTKASDDQAEQFVRQFTQIVGEYLANGEKVVMADFGSFDIAPDKTIVFHPSAKLKKLID